MGHRRRQNHLQQRVNSAKRKSNNELRNAIGAMQLQFQVRNSSRHVRITFQVGGKTCGSHSDPYPSLACSSSPLMAVKDFHFEFQNYVNRRALKEKNYKINHCFKARCEVKSSFPVLSILVLWPTTCRDGNRFEKKTHYNYTLKCFCWKKTLFRNEPLVLWHQLRCIFRLGYFWL